MRKTLVTFGLTIVVGVTGHDIATFPRRTLGPRDVSVADSHEELVATEPLDDSDEEESGSGVAEISGRTSLTFNTSGSAAGLGALSSSA
jgi:hypothetical protein